MKKKRPKMYNGRKRTVDLRKTPHEGYSSTICIGDWWSWLEIMAGVKRTTTELISCLSIKAKMCFRCFVRSTISTILESHKFSVCLIIRRCVTSFAHRLPGLKVIKVSRNKPTRYQICHIIRCNVGLQFADFYERLKWRWRRRGATEKGDGHFLP